MKSEAREDVKKVVKEQSVQRSQPMQPTQPPQPVQNQPVQPTQQILTEPSHPAIQCAPPAEPEPVRIKREPVEELPSLYVLRIKRECLEEEEMEEISDSFLEFNDE